MMGKQSEIPDLHLSLAERTDVNGMLEIYRPIVETSHTSFEYNVPNLFEFESRVANNLEKWPWLVCKSSGRVIGYAYAVQLRGRIAYTWSCELSVYVREGYRELGIGRRLYQCLMDILDWMGVRNFYGVIALPNDSSERFHAKLGFEKVAFMPAAGFKNRWIDMAWYLKRVGGEEPPNDLRSMNQLRNSPFLDSICSKYSTAD